MPLYTVFPPPVRAQGISEAQHARLQPWVRNESTMGFMIYLIISHLGKRTNKQKLVPAFACATAQDSQEAGRRRIGRRRRGHLRLSQQPIEAILEHAVIVPSRYAFRRSGFKTYFGPLESRCVTVVDERRKRRKWATDAGFRRGGRGKPVVRVNDI